MQLDMDDCDAIDNDTSQDVGILGILHGMEAAPRAVLGSRPAAGTKEVISIN